MTENQAWWLLVQNWIIICFLIGFVIYKIMFPPSLFKDYVMRHLDMMRGDLEVFRHYLHEIEKNTKQEW